MPILNTLLNGFRSAAGVGGVSPRRSPRLPKITAGEAGENRRTVDALLKTGADGLLPDIYAEEIAARGPAGRAYFLDFDRELRRRDPSRADRLRGSVFGRLAADDRAAMAIALRDADGGNDDGGDEWGSDRPYLIGPGGEGQDSESPPPGRRPKQPGEAPPPKVEDERDAWDVLFDILFDDAEEDAKKRYWEKVTGDPKGKKKAKPKPPKPARPTRGGGGGGGGGVFGTNPKQPWRRFPFGRRLPNL